MNRTQHSIPTFLGNKTKSSGKEDEPSSNSSQCSSLSDKGNSPIRKFKCHFCSEPSSNLVCCLQCVTHYCINCISSIVKSLPGDRVFTNAQIHCWICFICWGDCPCSKCLAHSSRDKPASCCTCRAFSSLESLSDYKNSKEKAEYYQKANRLLLLFQGDMKERCSKCTKLFDDVIEFVLLSVTGKKPKDLEEEAAFQTPEPVKATPIIKSPKPILPSVAKPKAGKPAISTPCQSPSQPQAKYQCNQAVNVMLKGIFDAMTSFLIKSQNSNTQIAKSVLLAQELIPQLNDVKDKAITEELKANLLSIRKYLIPQMKRLNLFKDIQKSKMSSLLLQSFFQANSDFSVINHIEAFHQFALSLNQHKPPEPMSQFLLENVMKTTPMESIPGEDNKEASLTDDLRDLLLDYQKGNIFTPLNSLPSGQGTNHFTFGLNQTNAQWPNDASLIQQILHPSGHSSSHSLYPMNLPAFNGIDPNCKLQGNNLLLNE